MEPTTFAAQVVDEHELFLLALNGRYLQLLQPGSKPTPRDVVDFTRWSHVARQALVARMSEKAAALVASLTPTADNVTSERMQALAEGFDADFARITAESVQTVISALRAGRDDLGKMFTKALGGAMGQLLSNRVQKITFFAHDSADRKWDASRLLSFAAREFVYRLQLLKQLSDVGDGLAEVFYPDHEEDGLVFSPKGNDKAHPSFADLEKTVFHPNSKAEVIPHAAT